MNDLQIRDGSCRVTGLYDCCEQAHLVPATERDWWDKNMTGTSGFEIESAKNGLFFKIDLHCLFDACSTRVPGSRWLKRTGRLFTC